MKWLFGLILLLPVIYYLLLPPPSFPPAPPGSLVSAEPADTESPYRQAYYTNYSRSEIMDYYQRQFRFNLPPVFPQYRLNYPPEEAFTLIRDQTRSSWLEEIVHPWRESLYVNGFYPTKPTDQIYRNGIKYSNKITLRYVPSTPTVRFTTLALLLVLLIGLKYEILHP